MIAKILRHKNNVFFIEWMDKDMPQRGLAPAEICTPMKDDKVQIKKELESLIISYGIDWELELDGLIGKVTPYDLALKLRRAGIWTEDDVLENPQAVKGAIQAAYGADFAAVVGAAKRHKKSNH